MIKRILAVSLLPLLLLSLTGCGGSVDYKLSEGFRAGLAGTVAVMPVLWDAGETADEAEIGRLFRSIAVQNLRSRGYGVMRTGAVDARLEEFVDLNPGDIARALGVDAVLFLHVNKWKTRALANYAALKIEALYTLYSSRNSATLWSATYATGESDIRFDKAALKLSIIEIYEPRIARLTNSVFDTLPVYKGVRKQEKLYDWLP
ncbi:MAG: hypothetical protein ACE5DR_01960 [Thermodesulfobacteriota bacterium]